MKINAEVVAHAALRLLDGTGLDGLTMRLVADELGVRAPTLYWHVKNKRELLDAMAAIIFVEAMETLEAPRPGTPWQEWLAGSARRLRRTMLGHRDGARVLAGTYVMNPTLVRTLELTLRTLQDAGFPPREAAHAYAVLYHYTVGYTIEEQARSGAEYGEDDPYRPERIAQEIDAERYPLAAQVLSGMFTPDADTGFEHGLSVILAGMRPQESRSGVTDAASS
ncbi:TetR/AcrR family transcriptional regulator C-terminal domain-containing protein [Spirillospora sp. CA-294931]|uniref:TetR/AcrR family transcriptional regulator C-terminal domain-containing protein n=1 Tax=Spirillospora sp. CA-294931 TaxID=3240042 RepID=UPI003D8D4CA4